MNIEAQRISAAPIRRSLRVKASRQKAFDTFVGGMGAWWLKSHSLLGVPQTDVVIEPRAGGRWYEIGADGSEQSWGKVLAWDAPERVVLAWQLSPEFAYDPNLVTTIDVRFTDDGDHTIVDFEHRDLERFGEAAEAAREGMDGGWGELLASYQLAAEAA